jgi:ubiquinone/menaquinone biosynthesis C-methylase UbiE
VLARHPAARWTGIDASEAMLARAWERLPDAVLLLSRLEDPLPVGPFDLVVSTLAVHHLDGAGKQDLFARVADVLRQPGGRFVLGDVVVPRAGEEGAIEIFRTGPPTSSRGSRRRGSRPPPRTCAPTWRCSRRISRKPPRGSASISRWRREAAKDT